MLQGVCIDKGQAIGLIEGMSYFLTPNGSNHFYVSKFPNPKAHFGCFESRLFKVQEEEWPEEPPIKDLGLDPTKVYKAKLIWRKKGYKFKELREYFIQPSKENGYFYLDPQCKEFAGCFPLHWCENFQEIDDSIMKFQKEIDDYLRNNKFHSDEDYLDYLREIAPIVKKLKGPETGVIGPYEFIYDGKFNVFRDGKEVDIYKFKQIEIFEFLAG